MPLVRGPQFENPAQHTEGTQGYKCSRLLVRRDGGRGDEGANSRRYRAMERGQILMAWAGGRKDFRCAHSHHRPVFCPLQPLEEVSPVPGCPG